MKIEKAVHEEEKTLWKGRCRCYTGRQWLTRPTPNLPCQLIACTLPLEILSQYSTSLNVCYDTFVCRIQIPIRLHKICMVDSPNLRLVSGRLVIEHTQSSVILPTCWIRVRLLCITWAAKMLSGMMRRKDEKGVPVSVAVKASSRYCKVTGRGFSRY